MEGFLMLTRYPDTLDVFWSKESLKKKEELKNLTSHERLRQSLNTKS